MGWAHCGEDDDGRPIGYAIEATCDYPGCETKIDRGLAYCCGGMHGGETLENHDGSVFITTCGKYFCAEHRIVIVVFVDGVDRGIEVCASCADEAEKYLGDYQDWPDSYKPPVEPESA